MTMKENVGSWWQLVVGGGWRWQLVVPGYP